MEGGWLHVVCGDVAAELLRGAGAVDPNAVRIQHDVLSVGPLLPFADLSTWKETRLAFWRREVWPGAPSFDAMPDDLMAKASELVDAAGVVLWVEDWLSHQLLIPSMERIAELAGRPHLPIQVGPVPLAPEVLWVLRRVWDGITAPEPRRLLEAISLSRELAPDFHRALGFFVTKYPDVRTGLARWDEELLRYAPGTPVELVGRALRGNGEWLDPVGDRVLHARLTHLADPALPHPALARRGEDLVLTSFGEEVLRGDKNFVEHNGLDTWIAGVHLDAAAGNVWFRQGAGLVRAGD